jgi:alpha-tubulin suppressor-like RCC1 family protein
MPTFYHYTQNGSKYSFDDVFVPAHAFRQGNLWISGNGCGDNTSISRSTPVTTFAGGANWKQVSCNFIDCAIKTDGTLWVWSGIILGTNNTINRSTPVTTFAGGTNWKQVSSGYYHTSAIKTDGTLWIWGDNSYAIIGTNDTSNKLTPVTTFAGGTNWKQVSCGGYHTAAIKTDGTLWVWGRNNRGQLGKSGGGTASTPVTTFAGGNNWKQVASGYEHIAAIKTDGTLWTWGYNPGGQLGDNSITSKNTPVTTFAGGNNWKQVACGRRHTAAIKTDGTLWIWGRNDTTGALGTNNLINRSTPVTTFAGGNNWKQVACFDSTAAIKTDGTLWVWGRNNNGQLGINNTISRSTPVTTFIGGATWKQVDIGPTTFMATTYIDDYI